MQLEQPVIQAAAGEQLRVRAALAQRALAQHQDAVGALDGGEAMRDHQRGAVLEQLVERALDQRLGFAVDAGSRLIHHQHARIVGERAGEREQLALAGGKVGAALADFLMQPAGQTLDEVQRLRAPERLAHLGLAKVGTGEADVVEHVAGEEKNVLLHQADRATQRA